jgi:CBS domain-containing protein
MSIQAIVYEKGENVATISPSTPIRDAAARLNEQDADALAVTEGDTILGTLSERDIVDAFSRHGAHIATMTVGDVLKSNVVTVSPEDSLTRAMRLMMRNRARHLLVLRDAKLAGVVSMDDVLQHRLEELQVDTDAFRHAHVAAH